MKTIFTLIQDKLVQNSEILKDSNSLNCSSNSNSLKDSNIEIFDVSILNEKLEKISSLLKNSNSKGDFKNMEVSRIDKIRDELYSLTVSTETLDALYKTSRLVDLDEVGKMLIESKSKIEKLRKHQSFLGNLSSNLPIVSKFIGTVKLEANLQQSINEYSEQMLKIFDKKYEEIVDYLENLEILEKQFKNEIQNINDFINKYENIQNLNTSNNSSNENLTVSENLKLAKIITEAKSEVIRKVSSVESLLKPTITLATELINNINAITPVLKDKIYTELKTMIGLNSFRDAAKMTNEFKNQIVEMEKFNTKARTETLVEILKTVETNLMDKKDFEELERLREQGDIEVKKAISDLTKKRDENMKFITEKYEKLKETKKLEALIDVETIN
jgi:hypothetical protein